MVYATQPFNHAKQLVMLRLSSSYLIRDNFSCHFLSLEISKNCISWDFFNRFPALAAVTTTGFRISSWSVMLSSSAYLAASFKSDWWPHATACSSNSLTASTIWFELLLVSADRMPLPLFPLGRYNKEVRLSGCLPSFSTMIFRAAISTSLNSDRALCCVHVKYRSTGSAYWLVACTRWQLDRGLDHIIDILRRYYLAAHARASRSSWRTFSNIPRNLWCFPSSRTMMVVVSSILIPDSSSTWAPLFTLPLSTFSDSSGGRYPASLL